MKRVFSLLLGGLAMIAVALISAFIAMRLAIHGREAVVPPLTGLSVAEAYKAAGKEGLSLTLENRFYSSETSAGHILAQDPPPGSRVRRDWPVRITESLGSQAVSIPNLTGQSERAATVSIRRLALDLGVVAHLPVAGDTDVVLTQTPSANSAGVDSPRVSLLVSDAENTSSAVYVMPSLVGLTFAAAGTRAATMGLHLTPAVEPSQAPAARSPSPEGNGATNAPMPPPVISISGVVVAQLPLAGRRVQAGDVVRVTLTRPETVTETSAASQP